MAEGVGFSSSTENDNSSELSGVQDNFSEISNVSEVSLLPQIQVEPYLFEPKPSLE